MYFPATRLRRLRMSANLRNLVRENYLNVNDLINPIFVATGTGIKNEIPSMPGIYQYSLDTLEEEIKATVELNIPAVLLFGIPDHKDECASSAYDTDGIVQKAVRKIKEIAPDLLVITDVCLCEYTSHGHCGMIDGDKILNDDTLPLLAKTALSHAKAGADMVAPSDMMDGRVGAIRQMLDENGFTDVSIMAYSAKYASAYYGPFRDAADSAPQFGDRKSYQMDPPNSREAIRETALDIQEGADIVMVKPGLAYLDILYQVREHFAMPTCVYNVSGEYSMVKAAAQNGWIDEKKIVLETLTGMKRAGADMIITYHAKDAARWLKEDK